MSQKKRGPRGGKTTLTPGGLRRKVFYLKEEENQALRRKAYEDETTESELVRQALRRFLNLPPEENE